MFLRITNPPPKHLNTPDAPILKSPVWNLPFSYFSIHSPVRFCCLNPSTVLNLTTHLYFYSVQAFMNHPSMLCHKWTEAMRPWNSQPLPLLRSSQHGLTRLRKQATGGESLSPKRWKIFGDPSIPCCCPWSLRGQLKGFFHVFLGEKHALAFVRLWYTCLQSPRWCQLSNPTAACSKAPHLLTVNVFSLLCWPPSALLRSSCPCTMPLVGGPLSISLRSKRARKGLKQKNSCQDLSVSFNHISYPKHRGKKLLPSPNQEI